ncbi:hypothetical protein M8J76_006707 [Diaphorina citri]|nr:hypothetical protein M8J76_006707 [Diaphorina citri]
MAKRRCTLEKKPKPTAKVNVVKRIAPLISALDVPSIRFLTDLLEQCGLVNFYRQDARRNRLQDLYCRLQHSLLLFFMAVHFLSTITRAVHYLPVFIECFFEDVVMFNFYAQICIYRRRHRQISALTAIMEKSFSRADEGIVRADARVIRTVFYLFVMAIGGVAVATLLVALIPLTQAETDIRRQLYNMKYPDRLLPSEVKIPFVDESELPNYVFIFVFFAYIVLVSLILAAITINMIPFVTIHLRGQYSMLCNFMVSVFGLNVLVQTIVNFTATSLCLYQLLLGANNKGDGALSKLRSYQFIENCLILVTGVEIPEFRVRNSEQAADRYKQYNNE